MAFYFLSNSELITEKEKKQMSEKVYAYLCNTHMCERYRCISKEATEMRLVGSTNGVDYYMEFAAIEGRRHEN